MRYARNHKKQNKNKGGKCDDVKVLVDTMTRSLARGQRIEIRGFGSFDLNHRPARIGRNPKTGERVEVPEKHVPHFKPGKELRERVDLALQESAH